MTDFEAETQKIELEKRRLEVEKMRVEIADASLAFWKRPGYLAGLSPLLIAFAGVFTAWVTGYFDTQRTQLANDIAALESEKSALVAEVGEAQNTIDLGYLSIRLAAEEAEYALGHFEAVSEPFETGMEILMTHQDKLPPEALDALGPLTDGAADRHNIIEITKDSLADLSAQLSEIDASDEVKALSTGPFLRSLGLFRSEDGRLFDVSEGRFLSEQEALELAEENPFLNR